MPKLAIISVFCHEFPQNQFTFQNMAQDLLGRAEFELLAVDNTIMEHITTDQAMAQHSSDAIQAAARINPWLKHIEYKTALSHWQGKQYATTKTDADYFFFVDAHCIISRDGLHNMFKYYVENEEKINGSLHAALTYKILESRRLIYKPGFDLNEQGERSFFTYSFTGLPGDKTEPFEVPVMSTCGMMVSRKVYDRVGGFPMNMSRYGGGENHFNYTQSVLGHKKWIYPATTCFHHGAKRDYSYTFDTMLKNRIIAHYLFGGVRIAQRFVSVAKGNPAVKLKMLDEVLRENKKQREHIKRQQVYTINEWCSKYNL